MFQPSPYPGVRVRWALALLLASLSVLHSAEPPPTAAGLLEVFPKSDAPVLDAKRSEFVVSKQFAPGQHFPSRWVEGVDERPAFHAYLMHQSTDERSWEMRIVHLLIRPRSNPRGAKLHVIDP